MIGFYTAIDKLKTHLDNDALVNSVSEGDIFQVDLAKQTIFPLVHIMVNSCTFETNVLRFNISLIAMDLVDISKNEVTSVYLGSDNTQDAIRHGTFAPWGNRVKRVKQINAQTGALIATYLSISAAFRAVPSTHISGISLCCNGKARTHAGFKWGFAAYE